LDEGIDIEVLQQLKKVLFIFYLIETNLRLGKPKYKRVEQSIWMPVRHHLQHSRLQQSNPGIILHKTFIFLIF